MGTAEQIRRGDPRAAARLMRWVDDGDSRAWPVLADLYPVTGQARVVGVTGSPGVGKSSLIDGLIALWREAGRRVGVVAVDPTSPFTGGAILGDRVRMQRHAGDAGVFIRSLATRGQLGGLSASAGTVAQVLDAMGCDRVVIETVGVGQDEVDIVRHADVTVVVVAPGQGDEVQAHKAGVLEIADVLVVNKADHPGVERTVAELTLAVDMAPAGARRPRVLRCTATDGTGLRELVAEVERLLRDQEDGGRRASALRERTEALVLDLAARRFRADAEAAMRGDPVVRETLARLHRRETDPFRAAEALWERVRGGQVAGESPKTG